MYNRFLVVVHAGDASLHPRWLATSGPRNWDLVVCYGGRHPGRYENPQEAVVCLDRIGPRWPVLARLLEDTHAGWRDYDHIWLPTDDLAVSGDDINRLFEIAAGLALPLAQPSFAAGSVACSPLALHNRAFGLRFTSFVDPAAPLFSRALLERALPGLAEGDPATLGERWPRLLAQPARECAVIDRVQVQRTAGTAAPAPASALCWGGFDATGRMHHLFDPADDGFLNRLRDGYAGLPAAAAATLQASLDEHAAARREALQAAVPAAPPAATPAFALTVGTSIAPQGEAKQQRAVASWRALGFDVVSFNNAAEIAQLQGRYPGVRFVEVARDGRERTGKPLVHVDDVFAWFRASGLPYGGFVNSDIVLRPADPAGFLASLRANLDGALLFSRRVEVERLDQAEGTFYPTGFDVWFWDRRVLDAFREPTDYFVGFPHWDYYAVLMPLVHGFPVRQFTFPFAFHETHAMYYDVVRDGIPYGLKTFERLAPHLDRIPAQNHLIKPVIDFFVKHRPPALRTPDDIAYYHAFLHALDLWFLDVIDRNSAKIRHADARPAEPDAGLPFLGRTAPVPAREAPAPAPASAPAPAAAAAPAAAPVLSVIIPTFNRAAILERCLAHLAAQTLAAERFEVIVVDDGSSDATPQVVEAAARTLRIVAERQANLGPAAARNRGLRRARGDWVMWLNDDALLEPQALQIHLDEHARRGPRAAVLGAFPMHPDYVRADGPLGYCLDHSDLVFGYIHLQPGRAYGHEHFYTCNLSLAREFVLAHGGFDDGFVRMGAEDIELGRRLQRDGCQVFYRPDCVAHHAHRLDADGLARMYQFRGRGGVHLFVREPGERPHYAAMPVARVDALLALDARLKPLLARLGRAIARVDGLRFAPAGTRRATFDERSTGIDFRMLWEWPDAQIGEIVQTLAERLEHDADRFAAGASPSVEAAAARLYPALQFVKWYHDTLGVVSSPEIRDYLAARQDLRARIAA